MLLNKFLKDYETEANRSLIFEYLFHILREPSTDFTSEYPKRELVIVSDLMQHSKRFSFYSHCKTELSNVPNKCRSFKNLLKKTKVKNYIDDRKPKAETLKNLKVTITKKPIVALLKEIFIMQTYQMIQMHLKNLQIN